MKKLFTVLATLVLCSVTLLSQDATKLYERKPYYIQSAINYGKDQGGFWDIKGTPKKITKGMNIQVYDLDKKKDRQFYMFPTDKDGYYEVVVGWSTKTRLDVAGGGPKMKTDGANIHIWNKNGGDWQKFRFKHLGNGKFRIYTTSGMALCLDGRISKNGSNVHIWGDHEGDWMDWYLIDTETNKPFIPRTLKPYDMSKPDFFVRNKNKTFKYISSLAFGPGLEGTAKVKKVVGNKVFLKVEGETRDMQTGKMVKRSFDYELNYRNDGYYWRGDWDVPENSRGKVKVYPDGKQVLTLEGEQHAIDITVYAD